MERKMMKGDPVRAGSVKINSTMLTAPEEPPHEEVANAP